jgi:diaminopropionate ammonia-lyase
VLDFHRSLPGYAPSPLVDAQALAHRLGVASVHVKDESSRLGMPSFKILGASWATYRALVERLGLDLDDVKGLPVLAELMADDSAGRDLTLVAATDGNHGRAVARMAKLLGLSAHILVPRDMVAERIEAIRGEGATVAVVDGTYDEAIAGSAALADADHVVISDTSWEGYEQVPGWVIDGYRTIVEEILDELAEPPTLVVAQMGVGAFAAAMIRGFAPRGARIVGAEPTKAACVLESVSAGELVQIDGALDSIMAGLNCGTPSPLAWPTLQAGLSSVAAVSDADAEEAMRALAEVGVVSGESGAAGLAALLAHSDALGLRATDRVLLVSTEGATDHAAYERIVGP